mgnify:CR=1 FL=1
MCGHGLHNDDTILVGALDFPHQDFFHEGAKDQDTKSNFGVTSSITGNDVAVTNGKDALKSLQATDAPRLALLDWMMPGMTGK